QPVSELGVLKEITLTRGEDVLEVELTIDAYSFHRVFELFEPERIVIDLYRIGDIQAEPFIEVNDFYIKRIRHGMFQRAVARVVFDIEEEFPFYGVERKPDGLKVTFSTKGMPPEETSLSAEPPLDEIKEKAETRADEVKAETPDVKTEEKKEEAIGEKTEVKKEAESTPEVQTKKEAAEKTEEQTEETAVTVEEQLAETRKKLEETISILNELNEERLLRKKKFVRVMATGNFFSPREGNLKAVYEKGMMFGAEINVGVTDFVEVWLAEHYFSKTVIDEVTEAESKVNLIPLELGIKVRLNKGLANPYFGIGGGYFQYREETPEGEIRERNIGFIGQAGLFVKISGFFVVDLYVQFKHCPITTETDDTFDIGGFHFGGGVGFEF
ncbi:MAG: AMIN domain-containing protein, partial [Candidatus Aminicenantes bacterium]